MSGGKEGNGRLLPCSLHWVSLTLECCVWGAPIFISSYSGSASKANATKDRVVKSPVPWEDAQSSGYWPNGTPGDTIQAVQDSCVWIQIGDTWSSQGPTRGFWYLKTYRAAQQKYLRSAISDCRVLIPFQVVLNIDLNIDPNITEDKKAAKQMDADSRREGLYLLL